MMLPNNKTKNAWLGRIAVLCFLPMLFSCATAKPMLYSVDTIFHRQVVMGDADSEVAKYYIEQYRNGERQRPALDAQLYELEAEPGIPTAQRLSEITQQYSPDFTAAYLAHKLIEDKRNAPMQQRFDDWYARLLGNEQQQLPPNGLNRSDSAIIFVPGWYYITNPETGADFAAQRTMLDAQGVNNHLIEIDENGVVEENAELIFKALKEYTQQYRSIIVVSASKGCPETALALSKFDKNTQQIQGWMNVGGVLKGSIMADKGSKWPWTWFTKYMVIYGESLDGVKSLQTAKRSAVLDNITIPDAITVVNYVGVPMGSQVNPRSLGYGMMKNIGPNDGSTYILDAMYPGGITLVEMGIDHYMDHPHIDTKTLALALTLSEVINN